MVDPVRWSRVARAAARCRLQPAGRHLKRASVQAQTGRRTSNVEPTPRSLSAEMVPPIVSTTVREM